MGNGRTEVWENGKFVRVLEDPAKAPKAAAAPEPAAPSEPAAAAPKPKPAKKAKAA